MSDPFLGEIKIVGFNFPPRSWAGCGGQILPISQNTALYSLLGTFYGGDGVSTFALPDLRGRLPMHYGAGPGLSSRDISDKSGTETNTLSVSQMPSHNHTGVIKASGVEGDRADPTGAYPARSEDPVQPYGGSSAGSMADDCVEVGHSGSGQSVNNMPPFLALNFVIALAGVYPSRN